MIGRTTIAVALMALSTSATTAQDAKAFVGTWTGRTAGGASVQLDIPPGVAQGQPATYFFNGQQQAPQTPVMMGNQIRLNNPGPSYIVIGPVKGKTMPYVWTNGSNQARATLTKQ